MNDQLHLPVVQLSPSLYPQVIPFLEGIVQSGVGVPPQPGNGASPIAELNQQIEISLTIGTLLLVDDPKNFVDLCIGLDLFDKAAFDRGFIHINQTRAPWLGR
jgi:hypothetical protein